MPFCWYSESEAGQKSRTGRKLATLWTNVLDHGVPLHLDPQHRWRMSGGKAMAE
jgi:hypothetical protein